MPRWKLWMRRLCASILCLALVLVIAWIILCMVMIGFGDEKLAIETLGVCRNSTSSDSSLKIMTFNIFFIFCLPFGLGDCDTVDGRESRLKEIALWLSQRDEDVILVQEVWSLNDEVRTAISEEAGFCHSVMADKKEKGSGLAIFSKYPIVESDFRDFYDAFGAGKGLTPDPLMVDAYLFDKGVLYAKIDKDGSPIHLFNTHTISDFAQDEHKERLRQYNVIDEFVLSKNISADELVIVGGDLNEDRYCGENTEDSEPVCTNEDYYKVMLEELSAVDPTLVGDIRFTYSTEYNKLAKLTNDKSSNKLLDYLLYREDNLNPDNSTSCEIINAISNSTGEDMSDHMPLTCDYRF
mmetsp:Transcript_16065/g.37239  ORF Transcript_16065/g.37239 Transcript_16065/m.37239 type:complete len:352 (-) Transcript_16065:683-1738(-)